MTPDQYREEFPAKCGELFRLIEIVNDDIYAYVGIDFIQINTSVAAAEFISWEIELAMLKDVIKNYGGENAKP